MITQFLTVHGWRYAHCNGSWWRWDVDHGHWDPMGVEAHISRALVVLAEDMFPDQPKIARQLGMDYLILAWMRDLRPTLRTATLSGHPEPGSRVPSSQ